MRLIRIIISLSLLAGFTSAGYAESDASQDHWLLAKYDLNGDAKITQDEVAVKKLNIFRHMDMDSDGGVSFDEYKDVDFSRRQALLKARFGKLDTDRDGLITEKEYSTYMGLFSSIDSNGDGTLTSKEMGVEQQQAKVEDNSHCLLWFCFRTSLD